MKDLYLNNADKRVLERNHMLNDKHVKAAHTLLKKKFPHLGGLQSPLLLQTGGFQPLSSFEGGLILEGWFTEVKVS